MTKKLFVGDCHGDIDFLEKCMEYAKDHGASEIIQVGDWGFVWPRPNVLAKDVLRKANHVNNHCDYLSTLLNRYGVTMRFIDGNHDYFPWLDAMVTTYDENSPWWGSGEPEPVYLANKLYYQPRGSTYTDEDGTKFLFLGGAPSIDRSMRTPGRSWWPEEFITEEQYQRTLDAKGPFDVFVSHDAPYFPPGYGPKGDPEFCKHALQSMHHIKGVIARHKPPLHVHGHWHCRYEKKYGPTTTIGLDCNYANPLASVMLWSKE